MFFHLDLMKNQHSKNSSLVRQNGSRHVGRQVDYLDKDSRLKKKYTIMLRRKFVIYIYKGSSYAQDCRGKRCKGFIEDNTKKKK